MEHSFSSKMRVARNKEDSKSQTFEGTAQRGELVAAGSKLALKAPKKVDSPYLDITTVAI